MFKLLIPICCILFYSCENNNKSTESPRRLTNKDTSTKLFCMKEKDSAYFMRYQFDKKMNTSGVLIYYYQRNDEKDFKILFDAKNQSFKLIMNKKDTSLLSFERKRYYNVNSKSNEVLKFILNKDVIDGESSYFFNPDFGLLISKSNTWPNNKILVPENGSSESLQITALIYEIFSDNEFFKNIKPESKIKFTPPKLTE